jgi:hypothetical protein
LYAPHVIVVEITAAWKWLTLALGCGLGVARQGGRSREGGADLAARCSLASLTAHRVQVVVLLLILVSFIVLTSQTVYVRLGRYDRYVSAFRGLFVAFAVELGLMLASKVYYIVRKKAHANSCNGQGEEGTVSST